jgi:SusD family.
MKKINIIIACLGVLWASSCDVTRYPFNAIEQTQAFQTVDDAASLNNAMYNALRNRIQGIFMFTTDIQADLLHASFAFSNRKGSTYRWDWIDSDYALRDVWYYYYSALNNVNNFLDNVGKITTKTNEEAAKLTNLTGEAHLLRAYYYHQLVKLYAKDYEPASAATDPGVPLMLSYSITARPPRASVAEVYEQIVKDLAAARSMISTAGQAGSIRITKDCVPALEARVYLSMHRYTEAAASANELINSPLYPLVNTAARLKAIWHTDAVDESIMMLYSSSTELTASSSPVAYFDTYSAWSSTTGYYSPDFMPQQWVLDLYEDNDLRKAVYFEEKTVQLSGTLYNGIKLVNKYPGNPALFTTANNTNYRHKPKVFRVAEAYLVRAEALAWQSAQDATGALAALNTLRAARGLSALSGLTGDALKKAVMDERTREMAFEGTRIDDLKRWGLGFKRGAPQNEDAVLPGPSLLMEVAAGNNKLVWGIPSRDLLANENITQNPGWE